MSKFKVKIIDVNSKYPKLSITHNGSSWTSIRIENIQKEVPLIIDKLKAIYTSEVENGGCCSKWETPQCTYLNCDKFSFITFMEVTEGSKLK